jgi:hypothetical protein
MQFFRIGHFYAVHFRLQLSVKATNLRSRQKIALLIFFRDRPFRADLIRPVLFTGGIIGHERIQAGWASRYDGVPSGPYLGASQLDVQVEAMTERIGPAA